MLPGHVMSNYHFLKRPIQGASRTPAPNQTAPLYWQQAKYRPAGELKRTHAWLRRAIKQPERLSDQTNGVRKTTTDPKEKVLRTPFVWSESLSGCLIAR